MKKINIKKIKWYWWVMIVLVVLSILSRIGSFNKYFPFFAASDGWNKEERQVNSMNVLVTAGGNEPGWNIMIRGEKFDEEDVFGGDLSMNYGDQRYSGMVGKTWQKSYKDELQFRGDLYQAIGINEPEYSTSSKNVILYLKKENCFDDAGRENYWTAELNFNGESIVKGCADINFEPK